MDRRRTLAIVLAAALLLVLTWAWWSTPPPAEPASLPSPTATEPVAARPSAAKRPPKPAPDPSDPVTDLPPHVTDPADWAHELLALIEPVAVCGLEPAVGVGVGHLLNGVDDGPPYDGRFVPVVGGEAHLGWLEPSGQGWLAIDGYEPVAVTWANGTCQPDPVVLPEGTAWVTGHVRNAEREPEGKVVVEGCGTQARTDAGGHYAMAVHPGDCAVVAFRRDGLLFSITKPKSVAPAAGIELIVDFELPELPKAGLGVVIEGHDDGVHILDVLPGTAAHDAGLRSGDVFIEVDGTSTIGLPLQQFVELAVGEVGTEVEVVVRRGDSEERWLLDRRVLEE